MTINTGITVINTGTVTNSGTITNSGTLKALGTQSGAGTLTGNGTVTLPTTLTDSMVTLPQSSYAYTGSPIIPTVTVATTLWGKTIAFTKDTDYTVTRGTNNTFAGETVRITVTPKAGSAVLTGTAVEKTFAITTANSALALTTNKVDNTVTYGDTITFTANVSISATRGRSAAANTVDFYCGSEKLNDSTITITERGGTGTATFTYNTVDKKIPVGEDIEITAKYGGSGNLNGTTQTVSVTLNKKPIISAAVNAGQSKPYDGNSHFTGVLLTLNASDVLSGDTVTATADGTTASKDVGAAQSFTCTGVTVGGTHGGYYSLAHSAVIGKTVEITKATPSVTVTAAKKEKSFLRAIIGDHNDTIVLTATTAGANGEKPNGSVVFKNGGTTLATVNTSNGVATCDWVNPPANNSITITAEFTATDSNYVNTAVAGTSNAFDIDKGAQKNFAITPVTGKAYGDGTFTLATTGGSGTGTTVSYASGDTSVLTISGDTATIVGAGKSTITATKEGDSNFNPATATYEITIEKATPTISWGANTVQTVTYTGTAAVITLPTVTLANSEVYGGEITYTYTAKAKLSNLFGLFAERSSTLPINAGVYEITAHTAEFGNYTTATSGTMILTIEKMTSTLTINSMAGKTYNGTAVADPTGISSNIANPTVTYTYYKDNSNAVGDALGSAPKNAGKYWVKGTIAETGNTTAVNSAAVSFTIAPAKLTVTGGEVEAKPWDGDVTATVKGLTFGGLQNGETLELTTDYTVDSSTYNDATVGNGKTVTGTATLVSNARTNNYSLTGAYSITGNITLADGPAAPTNGVVNDNKGTDTFSFTLVSGITDVTKYEYSTNSGTDWKGVTANSIVIGNIAVPKGELQVRVKETATHKAGEILSNETAFTASIEGSVSITGTTTYGETLTATASGCQTGAELHYLWKAGTETVGTDGSTYIIEGKAVGKTITVEVTVDCQHFSRQLF